MSFYICRPMTAEEWLALNPKQRASVLDMEDATKKRPPMTERSDMSGEGKPTAVCESGDHERCAGWHTAAKPYGPCCCSCHAEKCPPHDFPLLKEDLWEALRRNVACPDCGLEISEAFGAFMRIEPCNVQRRPPMTEKRHER